MKWNGALEQGALGFLTSAGICLALSSSPLQFFLATLAATVAGVVYGLLRSLPWKRIVASKGSQACVSVDPKTLSFVEVSTKAPLTNGFLRFSGMDKKEAFKRLAGKTINPATIPFHIRVHMEEGRPLDLPFSVLEPHLMEKK